MRPIPIEKVCSLCGRSSPLIAARLGLCLECIRRRPQQAIEWATLVHKEVRVQHGQVPQPPADPNGVLCPLCARACCIQEGGLGYCGLRKVEKGRLRHLAGSQRQGLLHWYRDGLPTNCVADFVCKGHAQHGCHNLAVFYGACTLSCLFCQNWAYRYMSPTRDGLLSAYQLAAVANDQTYCICYFGGDPSAQMPHALVTSRILAKRGVSICFETNGLANPKLMQAAVRLVDQSQGIIKFDLKALDSNLHQVLTSADNTRVLENFRDAANTLANQKQKPRLVAATLLVPGYVDPIEVKGLADFIASIDPNIPYSLLAFAPQFMMSDLTCTSRAHALTAKQAALAAGLKRVHIGNLHLLSTDYEVDNI